MLSLRLAVSRAACLHSSAASLASEIRFTKKHEWIRVKGEEGTVGITQFATEQLGDVVFVELPTVGAEVGAGDSIAAVESVKAASDIYSPVSGTVSARNDQLESEPALLNKSPLENGWIYKLKLKDPKELAALLDEAQYEKVKAEEAH